MPQVSDTRLFRQAFKDAGFRPPSPHWVLPTVFNDKHKDGTTRRLKLCFGDRVFEAPQHAQIELERQLKLKFGDRYLFGQFIESSVGPQYSGKSFCVYLLAA